MTEKNNASKNGFSLTPILAAIGSAVTVLVVYSFISHPTPIGAVAGAHTSKNDMVGSVKDTATRTASGIGQNVLGIATHLVSRVASSSASRVENTIYDITMGNILKQIDRLPQDQQDRIRKYICK